MAHDDDDDAAISPRHMLSPPHDSDTNHRDFPIVNDAASPTQVIPSHHAQESTGSSAQPMFMSQPSSLPFSEVDNPDAMALRAAISVLQMQRDKSKRDLQTLEKLKQAAIAQPELFAEELAAGRLRQDTDHSNPLQATFESDSSNEENDEDETAESVEPESKFPKFPTMQNVFRAPPINWARYNVVGEPLDRMHEEQRLRPGHIDVLKDDVPEHVIAAPYSPFTDKLPEQQLQAVRRASHKPI